MRYSIQEAGRMNIAQFARALQGSRYPDLVEAGKFRFELLAGMTPSHDKYTRYLAETAAIVAELKRRAGP